MSQTEFIIDGEFYWDDYEEMKSTYFVMPFESAWCGWLHAEVYRYGGNPVTSIDKASNCRFL